MRRTSFWIIVTTVLLVAPDGWAQQQGNRGAGSSSGQTTAGFAGLGNSNGGVNTTGFSLSNRFQSNFGRFTGGSQSIGQTTAGVNAASGVFGQGTSNAGRGGLSGSSRSSFGSSFGNIGRGFGAGLGYGMSPFGMGGFGRGGFGRSGRGGTNNQNRGVIRTHLKLGPQLALVRKNIVMKAAPKILRSTSTRLNKIMERSGQIAAPIALELKDGRVVLTGRVRTEHARKLAENLARLEPGIWELENELIVDPDAPTPSTAPKPSAEDQHQ